MRLRPAQSPLPDLGGPALLDPETSIPTGAELLFSCPPAERYAIVHRAFAPDALYYNSFVRHSPFLLTVAWPGPGLCAP
jgi:hypothetical protein